MTTSPEAGYPGELRVYGDPERLASAAAELFVSAAAEAITARGRFRVALAGGSTPRRAYELLATDAFKGRVDWDHVDIFWGDERYVPADDRDSNYRMTADALLRHVPVPTANVHRVPTEISPPSAAAAAYENEIRQSFGGSSALPQFDLIYLGLGTNGHTASLFPHSPALKETSRLVLADFVAGVIPPHPAKRDKNRLAGDPGHAWRISMSAPLLNRGRTVAFLIAGREKAQVLRDVLLGPRDPERLPAQLIVPEGNLLWLADAAAASLTAG
ncbi:MAG: 6-phosphogluconolactonase [Candidatus Korobacteraceae bacterium]|jgi:6-phosphogluconolactonase